jgi:hypothetical protein
MKIMLAIPLVALIMISFAASHDPVPPKATELFGEVRLAGKAVENGRILFYRGEGQIVGCIIRDGKFKIEKPSVGKQTVTIDGQNIPKKYSDWEKSGLVIEITHGINNRFDFDLK